MKCEFCQAELAPPRKTMCEACERKWNLGAAWADAHWHETKYTGYDDRSTDGRLIRHEYDGTFKEHKVERGKDE